MERVIKLRCPLCDVKMKEVERRGVTIDICPECKGVWLDKGELDRLLSLDRAEEEAAYREKKPEYKETRSVGEKHHKKRKSLLGEIFEVFD